MNGFFKSYLCVLKNQIPFVFSFNLNLDADIHRSSITEAFECSLDLFPHLIYISELTKDFVNRAAGVLEIPKNRSFLETDIKCIHIYVLTSDALTSPSLLRRCKRTYINLYLVPLNMSSLNNE